MADHRPTAGDIKGAMRQIARLQETYDLPMSDYVGGVINGRVVTRPLSQSDVFQVSTMYYVFQVSIVFDVFR